VANRTINPKWLVGDYQLIDFGDGRKLESLGRYVIERPSPAAEGFRRLLPNRWDDADASFSIESRSWEFRHSWPAGLAIMGTGFVLPVEPKPFGHIGIFPEQQSNWEWLAKRTTTSSDAALNLFGYTGAATLALVAAGYRVTHVDAAKPNVVAAGEGAIGNGWDAPPIRFIVDDALKFTRRERRRNRRYHTILLDPPSYGHAPNGQAWRLERDLWPLLDEVLELLTPDSFRLLVTGHSAEIDAASILQYCRKHHLFCDADKRIEMEVGRSQLFDLMQRPLDTGYYFRAFTPARHSES
jgi:23S rRNA (cytosine1962-C5)-methyltransferase